MNIEISQEISNYTSADIHEVIGKTGALPSQINPVNTKRNLFGKVYTVFSPAYDNLFIQQAIYSIPPGSILVISTDKCYEAGYIGEILVTAALHRKISGIVIDGCIRDIEQLQNLDLPVFARGICIQGTSKDFDCGGYLEKEIVIGNCSIKIGDHIFCDMEGCVVIKTDQLSNLIEGLKNRKQKEIEILGELAKGKSTLELYNLGKK